MITSNCIVIDEQGELANKRQGMETNLLMDDDS